MLQVPDSWVSRVESIKNLINLQSIPEYISGDSVAKRIKCKLNGIFDRFWLDKINQINKIFCILILGLKENQQIISSIRCQTAKYDRFGH